MDTMGSPARMAHGIPQHEKDRLYLMEECELYNGMVIKAVQTIFQVLLQ